MLINILLTENKMSKYKLSKLSNVPYSTIQDICNGKTSINNCNAYTVYNIAKALNITSDLLIEHENRPSFEWFKSEICHKVKNFGELDFILQVLESNQIRILFNKKFYPECLYLLAMLDYLCHKNSLMLCENYNDIRHMKMSKPVYPLSMITYNSFVSDSEKPYDIQDAIPEFKKFNIIEKDIFDVF